VIVVICETTTSTTPAWSAPTYGAAVRCSVDWPNSPPIAVAEVAIFARPGARDVEVDRQGVPVAEPGRDLPVYGGQRRDHERQRPRRVVLGPFRARW
jgi:hypothetical protein